MTDTNSSASAVPPPQPQAQATRPPFPAVRALYAIGFGFVAYFVLFALFAVALLQFVVLALNGRVNEELQRFSTNLAHYLWDLAAFITFARDDPPFPLGPFPKRD